MYVKLNGEMVYLWRAVDHEGEILGSYVTRNRDKTAALAFMITSGITRHGGQRCVSIAEKIGCVPQTLHEWLKKAEVDGGKRAGVSSFIAGQT